MGDVKGDRDWATERAWRELQARGIAHSYHAAWQMTDEASRFGNACRFVPGGRLWVEVADGAAEWTVYYQEEENA